MVRSYYATPLEWRYRPWTLDFTFDDPGRFPFPHRELVNPYHDLPNTPALEWTPDDWDPALRFWTLDFDPQLIEWLQIVDPGRPSIRAAREVAQQHDKWKFDPDQLVSNGWLEERTVTAGVEQPGDVDWRVSAINPAADAWSSIRGELEELKQLMHDDRERYLAELDAQADGLADYMIAFIGATQARHPWTIELISCGLAISNVVYMHYKAVFKRVRPSTLCPGLVPPFGPPMHPAFPSGHSFAGHFIALLLLEIPALARRFGVFRVSDGSPGVAPGRNDLKGRAEIPSPLLWLAYRMGRNRERLGVHYPSDTFASRHLAAALWEALPHPEQAAAPQIDSPSLRMVQRKARAEWV